MNTSKVKRLGIKWHQLWLVRLTGLATLITLISYFGSMVIAIQGIQSVTHIAFDSEVEDLMGNYLKNIKDTHNFRKETYAARLARVIPIAYRRGEAPIQKPMISEWLKQIKLDEFVPLDQVIITEFNNDEKAKLPKKAISWIDSSTIKIWSFKVELPKKLIRQEFQSAEELVLRYRTIRANWQDEIRPTLITTQVAIVVITSLLLAITVIIAVSRFKKRVDELVKGFAIWSEEDSSYRFQESWAGELRVISSHFNLMANEVEENRNKRLYMEKVASWQIIARKLAHEIKNPLTPIQMMVSQLVRRYKGQDNEFQKLLENSKSIITEEVTSLRRMVDNFSEFAQMPQPKVSANDLTETISRVVELQKAGYPDIEIKFEHQDKSIALFDKHLIKQVLINIIKNAVEAGGSKIDVEISQAGRRNHITIKDNGPGIPEELQSRIFEAYFTTKHTGPSPGMGLGLAVCQKVMM